MNTIHHADGVWAGYIDMNLYTAWLAEPSPLDHDLKERPEGGEAFHKISKCKVWVCVCFSVGKSVFAYAGVKAAV